ncbi:MAG: hypothetical protein ABF868_05400 [Sporolactobacillus sp.]
MHRGSLKAVQVANSAESAALIESIFSENTAHPEALDAILLNAGAGFRRQRKTFAKLLFNCRARKALRGSPFTTSPRQQTSIERHFIHIILINTRYSNHVKMIIFAMQKHLFNPSCPLI